MADEPTGWAAWLAAGGGAGGTGILTWVLRISSRISELAATIGALKDASEDHDEEIAKMRDEISTLKTDTAVAAQAMGDFKEYVTEKLDSTTKSMDRLSEAIRESLAKRGDRDEDADSR